MKTAFYAICLSVLLLCFAEFACAQIDTVSISRLSAVQHVKNKPVLIFVYTSWCTYCHAMQQTTFKNKEVVKLLNDRFYNVFIDAEQKESLVYEGKTYYFKPTGLNTGIHEIAEELRKQTGSQSISYPFICLLNTTNEVIYHSDSFIGKSDFLKLLNATLAY